MKVIYLPHYAADEIILYLRQRYEYIKLCHLDEGCQKESFLKEIDRLSYYIHTIECADDEDDNDEKL